MRRNFACTPPAPAMRHKTARPAVIGKLYAVKDLGVPPGSTLSMPTAFSNSDVIVEAAINAKKDAIDCVLASSSGRFVDLTSSSIVAGCAANGVSNVDANGVVRFVGTAYGEVEHIAFIGTYSTLTNAE